MICLLFAGCDGAKIEDTTRAGETIIVNSPALEEFQKNAPGKPVLYALLAVSDTFRGSALARRFSNERGEQSPAEDNAAALTELLSRQRTGNLYSKIVIRNLSDDEFTKANFSGALSAIDSVMKNDDVLLVYISAYSGIDKAGNLFIIPWDGKDSNGKRNAGKQNISAQEIAEWILALETRKAVILIDTNRSGIQPELPLAAVRLAENLDRLPLVVSDNGGAAALLAAFENANNGRYVTPACIAGNSQAARDFIFLDRWLDPGELRVSSFFPGTVTITEKNRITEIFSLDSLESAVLRLPEGNYSLNMVYHNSFHERRAVEVLNNNSAAVSFTYRPHLDEGSFSGSLPAFGVDIAEINPRNYQKIDQNILSSMGMEQYRVSFLAGEKFYQAGDYDRAIAEFNRSAELKPDNAEVYIARGNALRKKGNLPQAAEDYSRALRYGSERAEVYNYRGYVYSEYGETGKALADFTRALEIRNDYADALVNRAHVYYETGDYQKAAEDYTRVIKLEARNAAAWNGRGSALYRLGDEAKAAADFTRALTIAPAYASAWRNRGNVSYNAGNYENALADLDEAIRLEQSADAYNARGNILLALGENDRAEADFAAALRMSD